MGLGAFKESHPLTWSRGGPVNHRPDELKFWTPVHHTDRKFMKVANKYANKIK